MSVLHVGTNTTLATLETSAINNNDVAYIWLNDYSRKMVFDATSTKASDTTNHPYYVRPSDYSSAGVWTEDVGAEQPEAWAGSSIATGSIKSTNWDETEGSEINLDAGTIKLGGSVDPAFSVTAAGVLTATGADITGNISAITGDIGGWSIGEYSLTSTLIGLHSVGYTEGAEILLGHATLYASAITAFKADGSGKLASGNISWTNAGAITFAGAVTSTATITGGTIQTAAANARSVLNADGLAIYDATTQRAKIGADGSGWLGASDIISWNAAGEVDISGFESKATGLEVTFGGNTVIVSSGVLAFIAGTTGSPTVTISQAGAITATLGTIGGWTIGSNISSTGIKLTPGASSEILLGTTTNYGTAAIGLKNDGSGKLASGNISWNAAGAITFAGAVTSTATITGGTIQTASLGARAVLDSSGLAIYDATAQRARIASDGSGWLGAPTVFSWTASGVIGLSGFTPVSTGLEVTGGGNTVIISSGVLAFIAGPTGSPTVSISQAGVLTATGVIVTGEITATTGAIGGWEVTADSIQESVAGAVGMSSAVTAGDDIRFWAGHATPSSAPFYVTEAGLVVCSNITVAGGIIGGFTPDPIEGIYVGDGVTRVQMKPGVGIWTGATAFGSAPFRVSNAGVLVATSATITGEITATSGAIGGFTLNALHLYTDSKTAYNDTNAGVHLGTDGIGFGNNIFTVSAAGALVATSATITGEITATTGAIGGWDVVSGYLYSLASGTPTSSPSDGLVLASGNEGIIVYEDTTKRIEIGYLTSGVYGLKVYAGNGSDVIFEVSDTQTIFAGFTPDTVEGMYAGIGATRVQMKAGSGIWTGATAIGDAPFSVTNAGVLISTSATITGTITATSGAIGGFTLNASHLYTGSKTVFNDTEAGIHIGTDGIGIGDNVFTVSDAGALVATSATITGVITATSGSFAGSIAASTIDIGGDDASSFHVDLTGGIWSGASIANKATAPFRVSNAGALVATSATVTGVVTANTGYIGGTGGWVISAGYLKDAAGVVGLSSVVAGVGDIRFWAGHVTPTSAPFYVTKEGALVATSATITGVITANTGYIGGTGGWEIATGYIKKDTGTDATSSGMVPADYPFYAGKEYADRATAPFRVSNAGALVATSTTITGEITATSGTFAGTINAFSGSIVGSLIMGSDSGAIHSAGKTSYADTTAGFFLGDSGTAVNIGNVLSSTAYSVAITPTGDSENVGAIYVDNKTTTSFVVKCTGTGIPSFDWIAVDTDGVVETTLGVYSGNDTFAGSAGATVSIGHTLSGSAYDVAITPTGDSESVGSIYVDTKTTSTFKVKCTGTGTPTFDWILVDQANIVEATLGIYSDSDTFAGSAGATVSIGATLSGTAYDISIIPTGDSEDVGSIWVDTKTTSTFKVKCTGTGTPTFDWVLVDKDSIYSATLGINSGEEYFDGIATGAKLNIGDVTNYLKWDGTDLSWAGTNASLTTAGVFTASNAVITGEITATTGAIGNWVVGTDSLTSTLIGLHSVGYTEGAEILLGHATLYASAITGFKADGSGKLADGNISWTDAGAITFAGAVTSTATITGGTIQTAAANARSVLNADGLAVYDATTQRAKIGSDGAGWLGASDIISWNVAGEVDISGFESTATGLEVTSGGNTVIVSSGALAFVAGTTGSPTVTISQAGVLTATGVAVSGEITAATGAIGGWDVGTDSLTSTLIGLHSVGYTEGAEILLGHATLYASAITGFKADGSGKLADGNISWTAGGAITITGAFTSTATITGGTIQTASSGARSVLDSSGLAVYDATTQRAKIGSDGSGWLGADNILFWNSLGEVGLAGFTPTDDSISVINDGNTVALSSTATAIIAGPTGLPTFQVTQAGALVATSATITGVINANTGYFGGSTNGWIIASGSLTAKGTSIFQTSATVSTGIEIDSTSFRGYNGIVQTAEIKTDGSGWFGLIGTKAISWTTAGAVTIGGYTVNASALYSGVDATRIQLDTTAGIWCGATAFGSAPFRVNRAGTLVATSATITGHINASSGNITGNFGVSSSLIIGSTGSIFSSGKATYGSSNAGFWLGYDTTAYKLNIGDDGSYIKWDSGLSVKMAYGETFSLNGSLDVSAGGDITLTGANSNPGLIKFTGSSYAVTIGANAVGSVFEIAPDTDDSISLSIGGTVAGPFGANRYFSSVNVNAKGSSSLWSYPGTNTAGISADAKDGASDYGRCSMFINNGSGSRSLYFEQVTSDVPQLRPYPANTVDLGVSSSRWDNAYIRFLDISTSSTLGQGALKITQNDDVEPFIDFVGTLAANTTKSITSLTANNSIQGFVRVSIDTGGVVTDYWMPVYDAPTS